MRVSYPSGDGQSETGALAPTAGRIATIEAIKNMRELIIRNPDATVFDNERGGIVVGKHAQSHLTAGWSELYCVVEEDHHQSPNELAVSLDYGGVEVPDDHAHLLRLRDGSCGRGGIESQIVELKFFSLDGSVSSVGTRKHEQVVNDPTEPYRFGFDATEGVHIRVVIARLLQRNLRT